MRINLREKRTEAGWAEMWERPYRAVCEHTLKIASWSVLVGAVHYTAQKSGDWKLWLLDGLLSMALWGYIFSLIINMRIEIFPSKELDTRKKWATIVVNIVVATVILAILHGLSSTIISTFVQLQAQK
jgi:hypothetical protein